MDKRQKASESEVPLLPGLKTTRTGTLQSNFGRNPKKREKTLKAARKQRNITEKEQWFNECWLLNRNRESQFKAMISLNSEGKE